MKMIIAILNSDDASTVMHNLMKEGYQITKLSTTGGFLRAGNVTVLIGVEDDKLEHCLEIIGKYSKSRKQLIPSSAEAGISFYPSMPVEVVVGGATSSCWMWNSSRKSDRLCVCRICWGTSVSKRRSLPLSKRIFLSL